MVVTHQRVLGSDGVTVEDTKKYTQHLKFNEIRKGSRDYEKKLVQFLSFNVGGQKDGWFVFWLMSLVLKLEKIQIKKSVNKMKRRGFYKLKSVIITINYV